MPRICANKDHILWIDMFSRNNYVVCKFEYRTGTRTIEYRADGMDNVRWCVVVVTVYEVVASI